MQIMCDTSSVYHVQHVVLRATWYEGRAHLLSLTEFKWLLFQLYFIVFFCLFVFLRSPAISLGEIFAYVTVF